MDQFAKELRENGVAVVPCQVAFDLNSFLQGQREFKGITPSALSLGAFGAMGTPSSFHHPEIRKARQSAHDQLVGLFSLVHPGMNLEVLFDRFSKRRVGTTLTAESWHRDVGDYPNGDVVYGGWVNTDSIGSVPQSFSCIPGDVLPILDDETRKTGFVPFDQKNKALMQALTAKRRVYSVQPGHAIVFNQTIAHEILKTVVKADSYRLYIGWRITRDDMPIYDRFNEDFVKSKRKRLSVPLPLSEIVKRQACPPLPSGQMPPMYAQLHMSYPKNRTLHLEPFSLQFHDNYIDPKYGNVVMRFFPPLQEVGLEPFPPYSDADIAILVPHRMVDPDAI
jgi:hypothetical protein